MQRVEDNAFRVGCPKKSFWEMSKHPGAKRLHCGGAKVRVPITNKNEIKERKQNENDTTTNEKPSAASLTDDPALREYLLQRSAEDVGQPG